MGGGPPIVARPNRDALLTQMRWLRRFSALFGLIIIGAVCAAGAAIHLARRADYTEPLSALAARVPAVVAGQRVQALWLDVRVRPVRQTLQGRARWNVVAEENGRRRFYFLLDSGLELLSLEVEGRKTASASRVGPIVVVDVGQPASAGESFDLTMEYGGRPAGRSADGMLDARYVRLGSRRFWYPTDPLGMPFSAEVSVTLPEHFAVVHSGDSISKSHWGKLQRVEWRYSRPVHGLSLVAGPYRSARQVRDGAELRVFLPEGVDLDAERVIDSMARANHFLSARYGPSGFPTVGVYVDRQLCASDNDGSGLAAIALRDFRRGDYGYGAIAQEMARNWWGATVVTPWVPDAAGSPWVNEALAEFSRLAAIEERFGADAYTRALAAELYDPRRSVVLDRVSPLDLRLSHGVVADAARKKGAYVAVMLRNMLGEEPFWTAMRDLLERFRYRSMTTAEMEEALSSGTGQDLSEFFRAWVHGGEGIDLALAENEAGDRLALSNAGPNPAVGEVEVWSFAGDDDEPTVDHLEVGADVAPPPGGGEAVADPLAQWPDSRRDDNRFPRQRSPLYIAVSPGGDRAVVEGEEHEWSRATLRVVAADGQERGRWELAGAVLAAPQWIDEGRILLSLSQEGCRVPAVTVLETQRGEARILGHGRDPVASAGSVYAARGDRLLRWSLPAWSRRVLLRRARARLAQARPSADGKRVAYVADVAGDVEVRLYDTETESDRPLFEWDDVVRDIAWSSSGDLIYAVVGGTWDWQIWQVALDGGIRPVMRDAATLSRLVVGSAGRLAFGASELEGPAGRNVAYVLTPARRGARRIEVPGGDVRDLAWEGGDSLLAVARPARGSGVWYVPEPRELVRMQVADGAVERLK